MAVSYVTISDTYQPVTSNAPINVSTIIGDGQSGSSLIFVGASYKGTNVANVGTGLQVQGQYTVVSATVVDVQQETNWTSLTVSITENGQTKTYGPYTHQVAQNLDTVVFIIKILNSNAG